MGTPPLSDLVYVRLSWGRDRALTIGALAESMAVSRRAVEKAVEELRASGKPVCSGSDGIWLTVDPREMLANAERLEARAVHQLSGARALRATAARFAAAQQLELWAA